MRTICSREIFTKKCRQQQNFDSDPKEAWHYNHVTFTPIAKNFMLYCRLIKMLSMPYVRLLIKVKVRTPENFKVGWYPHKITFQGRVTLIASHLAPLWNRLEQRNSETTHLRDTNKRQGAHIHQPSAWPVPQRCTPPCPRAVWIAVSILLIDIDLIFHLILWIFFFFTPNNSIRGQCRFAVQQEALAAGI